MAYSADLVYQVSATTGTGNLTLVAVTGYRTWSSAFPTSSASDKQYYAIRHQSAAEYEIGLGYLSGGLFVRDTVLVSSNSNALVNFSAGTKDVICDLPASLQSQLVTLATDLAGKSNVGHTHTLSDIIDAGLLAALNDLSSFDTSDLAASTDKNYVTDADLVNLGNLSGTNTGDQTITLSGEASGSGTGGISVTLDNAAVIAKVLTGFSAGAGTVAATDTILQAFQKIVGNIAALVTGVSSVFGRSGAVTAQSGDYTTDQVTEATNLYYTDERAQDAVGGILVDSASVDLTYNGGTPSITATVLPAGVDHNSLANYVADQHVAHSGVSITTAANSGLAGGGTIAATRTLTLDLANLTTDTPVAGDWVGFGDVSGSDTNKCTIQNFMVAGHLAFAPNVAHVKADGTGTHATIAAANSDSAVSVILVYPGTHTLDNSAGAMTLAKTLIGVGGRFVTTLERTNTSKNAIQITSPTREFGGVTLAPATASEYWLFINMVTASRTLVKDINCLSSYGIKVRNSNGIIIERVSAVNVGVDFPTNPLLIGDASGVPTNLTIRDCVMNTVDETSIDIYGGTVDILDCSFSLSGFGAGNGINIQSTAAGIITTKTCTWDGVYNPVVADLSGGATYISIDDVMKNHSTDAVAITGGAGKFVINGSVMEYDPVGLGNNNYTVAAGTAVTGYYTDPYTGNFVSLGAATLDANSSDPVVGNAVLVGGTKTVTTSKATSTCVIQLSRKTAGGTIGDLTYTITAGTSFTINSASGTDTSTVSWQITETI